MKYITSEDYFKWSGINLELELKNMPTDNPSNAVDIFLNQEETWLEDVLLTCFDNTLEDLQKINKDTMRKALCYQIDSIRRNGLLRYDFNFNGLPLDINARRALRGYTNIARDGSKGWVVTDGKRFI